MPNVDRTLSETLPTGTEQADSEIAVGTNSSAIRAAQAAPAERIPSNRLNSPLRGFINQYKTDDGRIVE